jgi:hypothetical protein
MAAGMVLTDPCLVFALRRESMYFRRAFPYRYRFPGAPCLAQFRGPPERSVLMLETGIGSMAMESALRWCLSRPRLGGLIYRPRMVISLGFSGALQPEQRVGHLVLATEVVDWSGCRWKTAYLPSPDDCSLCAHGRVLTTAELVSRPQEKERLGQQFRALAVDMESAVAARLCQEHGVSFACMRAISDEMRTPLSRYLTDLLGHGRVSSARLAVKLMRHPALLGELWRLARQTRLAARRLLAVHSLLATPLG